MHKHAGTVPVHNVSKSCCRKHAHQSLRSTAGAVPDYPMGCECKHNAIPLNEIDHQQQTHMHPLLVIAAKCSQALHQRTVAVPALMKPTAFVNISTKDGRCMQAVRVHVLESQELLRASPFK